MKDYLRKWQNQGWSIETTKGNHLKLTHPNSKEFIIAASTPSDIRAIRNTEARMKRLLPAEMKLEKAREASPKKPQRKPQNALVFEGFQPVEPGTYRATTSYPLAMEIPGNLAKAQPSAIPEIPKAQPKAHTLATSLEAALAAIMAEEKKAKEIPVVAQPITQKKKHKFFIPLYVRKALERRILRRL